LIAVDTNILVYAHRAESSFHPIANRRLKELAESGAPWAIPWPCTHEFFGVVTNRRIYYVPTPPERALAQLDSWFRAPALSLISETSQHWSILRYMLEKSGVVGPIVHDARVAAICLEHGVREFWTADRDFSRFAGLRVINPLVGG
jgi:toxin-antitoxin system PIN domain toxin